VPRRVGYLRLRGADGVDRQRGWGGCGGRNLRHDSQRAGRVHRYQCAGLGRASQLKSPGLIKTHGAGSKQNGRACRCGPDPRCTVLYAGGGRMRGRIAGGARCRVTRRSVGKFWPSSATANVGQHRHQGADEEAQETFKKNFATTVTSAIPTAPKASRLAAEIRAEKPSPHRQTGLPPAAFAGGENTGKPTVLFCGGQRCRFQVGRISPGLLRLGMRH